MQLAKEKGVTLLGLNHKDEAENARRFLGGMGNPYAKVGVDASGTHEPRFRRLRGP